MSIVSVAIRNEVTKSLDSYGVVIHDLFVDVPEDSKIASVTATMELDGVKFKMPMEFAKGFFDAKEIAKAYLIAVKAERPYLHELV